MRIFTAGYFMNNLGDDLFLKILLEKYPNCKFVIIAGHNYKNKFPHKNLIIINTDSLLIRSIRFICSKLPKLAY